MTTSWVAKTPKNSSSDIHNHTNNFLSGVYYHRAPKENCGNIGLEILTEDKYRYLKQRNLQYGILINLILYHNQMYYCFPSWALHKILENKSGKDRLSIAFNFLPVLLSASRIHRSTFRLCNISLLNETGRPMCGLVSNVFLLMSNVEMLDHGLPLSLSLQ